MEIQETIKIRPRRIKSNKIYDISYKRPGFGIYPIDRHKIVGKKSKIKIMKDKIILAKYLKNK